MDYTEFEDLLFEGPLPQAPPIPLLQDPFGEVHYIPAPYVRRNPPLMWDRTFLNNYMDHEVDFYIRWHEAQLMNDRWEPAGDDDYNPPVLRQRAAAVQPTGFMSRHPFLRWLNRKIRTILGH